jgi:hypothetical protein
MVETALTVQQRVVGCERFMQRAFRPDERIEADEPGGTAARQRKELVQTELLGPGSVTLILETQRIVPALIFAHRDQAVAYAQ